MPDTLPKKTDEWLSLPEINKRPGSQSQPVKKLIGELFDACDKEKSDIQKIKNNGQVIRVQQMKTESGASVICIAESDWDKVTTAAGLGVLHELPEKTDAWLSEGDMKGLDGAGTRSVQKAVSDIIGAYSEEESGIQKIKYRQQTFSVQQMQAKQTTCLHCKRRLG